ncbi:MAG: tyrosine-type recombinase/integrase, partial [Oceanicaulis sp.]
DRRMGNVLRLIDQKSGKPGTVPLTPDAIEALEFLWAHPTWQRVTKGVENPGGTVNKTRLASARDWCIKRFTVIRNRAKLPDVTLHKLRHTTASRLVQADVPLYKVQKVLRHSSPAVTQRYADFAPDHLQDAVAVLSRRKRQQGAEGGNVIELTKRDKSGT